MPQSQIPRGTGNSGRALIPSIVSRLRQRPTSGNLRAEIRSSLPSPSSTPVSPAEAPQKPFYSQPNTPFCSTDSLPVPVSPQATDPLASLRRFSTTAVISAFKSTLSLIPDPLFSSPYPFPSHPPSFSIPHPSTNPLRLPTRKQIGPIPTMNATKCRRRLSAGRSPDTFPIDPIRDDQSLDIIDQFIADLADFKEGGLPARLSDDDSVSSHDDFDEGGETDVDHFEDITFVLASRKPVHIDSSHRRSTRQKTVSDRNDAGSWPINEWTFPPIHAERTDDSDLEEEDDTGLQESSEVRIALIGAFPYLT